jgi:hypothetical protein
MADGTLCAYDSEIRAWSSSIHFATLIHTCGAFGQSSQPTHSQWHIHLISAIELTKK